MKKLSCCIVLLILTTVSIPLYGGIYSWTDENGVKHFSDTAPSQDTEDIDLIEAPENSKPSDDYNEQKSDSFSPNQSIIDKTKTINSEEEKLLITQCTQVWQRYRAALARGNFEEALKYVSDNSQEEFRTAFQYQRGSVHLGDITRLEYIKDNVAQFKMLVNFKLLAHDDIPPGYSVGDTMESEGYVNFIQESTGEWKIDFY